MKTPTVLKKRIPSLVLVGISLSCALRASGAPQVANFSDDGKDRHVGKILLPVAPSKPITPGPTGVIKTSSTQSKAQVLLDSLKRTGVQSKAPVIVAAPSDSKEAKPADRKTEVKGAKGTDSAPDKSSPVVKRKSEQVSKAGAPNLADKKASPAVKGVLGNDAQSKEALLKAQSEEKGAAWDKLKKPSASSQHVRARTIRNDGFIPPPPPVQPSILMDGGMGAPGIMPFTVDYMNKDELLQKQKDLELQLSDAKGQLKDSEEAGSEKKTRAERFDPLYKEGVVSRHELEAAQKEAADVDKEVERAKNRVIDLQNQSASVERKLKEIAKRTLPVSASPRKKTRK
jgi:hypothetical protein